MNTEADFNELPKDIQNAIQSARSQSVEYGPMRRDLLLDFFLVAMRQKGLTFGWADKPNDAAIMRDALESISGMWNAQTMINRADEALDKITGGAWSR